MSATLLEKSDNRVEIDKYVGIPYTNFGEGQPARPAFKVLDYSFTRSNQYGGEEFMAKLKLSLLVLGGGLAAAAMSNIGAAGGSETINYSYDAKGRLIQVRHSGSVNNNVLVNYAFDDADNRKTMNVTGAP